VVGDVNRVAMIDMIAMFFHVRAASVGRTYKTEWTCRREVTPKGAPKQECGHKNPFVLDLGKLDSRMVPPGFETKRFTSTITVKEQSFTTSLWVRFLTVAEEFDVLDTLSNMGISRNQLAEPANLYKYGQQRLARAIQFSDQRANDLSPEARVDFLYGLPISMVNELFGELKNLDSNYGYDLSNFKVKCAKCQGESRMVIPFSRELLLSS